MFQYVRIKILLLIIVVPMYMYYLKMFARGFTYPATIVCLIGFPKNIYLFILCRWKSDGQVWTVRGFS